MSQFSLLYLIYCDELPSIISISDGSRIILRRGALLTFFISRKIRTKSVNKQSFSVFTSPLTKFHFVIGFPLAYFSRNRIYDKILDRDWFSARLFVT